MFTLLVQLDVFENRLDDFLAGIHRNAVASLRDEPGCLRFDVHRSSTLATRFHLYELYVDRDAFEVGHKSAAHYAAWREVVAQCVVPGSHINVFAEPAFPADIPEGVVRA